MAALLCFVFVLFFAGLAFSSSDQRIRSENGVIYIQGKDVTFKLDDGTTTQNMAVTSIISQLSAFPSDIQSAANSAKASAILVSNQTLQAAVVSVMNAASQDASAKALNATLEAIDASSEQTDAKLQVAIGDAVQLASLETQIAINNANTSIVNLCVKNTATQIQQAVVSIDASSIAALSAKTCEELTWSGPVNGVCVKVDMGGGSCVPATDHKTAKTICEKAGGRLCSGNELISGISKALGCTSVPVWSSSPCSNDLTSFTAVSVTSTPPLEICGNITGGYGVHCCADSVSKTRMTYGNVLNGLMDRVQKMEACEVTGQAFSSDLGRCVTPQALGGSPSTAARDCQEIKNSDSDLKNGLYYINAGTASVFKAFCDLQSSPAWTLIRSFSLANVASYRPPVGQFYNDNPRNGDTPDNFADYSMTLSQMKALRDRSALFRVTCNMDSSMTFDYALARLSFFDPLTFNGNAQCMRMEAINIKNQSCTNCGVKWWQSGSYSLNCDAASASGSCPNGPTFNNDVANEVAFGYYTTSSSHFSCTSSPSSTTNYWFAGCIASNLGACESNPGVDCNDIKANYPSAKNGYYFVRPKATVYRVYCDMTSSPEGWTLVRSFQLSLASTYNVPWWTDLPRNPLYPSLVSDYNMGLAQGKEFQSVTTRFRATCNMDVSYSQDYVVAQHAQLDLYNFTGIEICKQVDSLNIRGTSCTNCGVKWWQATGAYTAHIDSSYNHAACESGATISSTVSSEDNFGYYVTQNKAFTCSITSASTTNWWFGGCIPLYPGLCVSKPASNCQIIKDANPLAPSGLYWLNPAGITPFQAYCDLSSARAWALVRSFTSANAGVYTNRAFLDSFPRNPAQPTYRSDYNLDLATMKALQNVTTHFLATCNMDTSLKNNYALASHFDWNMLGFSGAGICLKMEDVWIRGYGCSNCQIRWWQTSGGYSLHIDSGNNHGGCINGPYTFESVASEDDFGYYASPSTAFPCTASASSTTNWWMGSCLPTYLGACRSNPGKDCSAIKRTNPSLKNGFYYISPSSSSSAILAYCDMESTGTSSDAWTLVRSYSLENRGYYQTVNWKTDTTRNQDYPANTDDYSMSLSNLQALQQGTLRFRVTCNMDTTPVRDFVIVRHSNLDIITFSGDAQCKFVDQINIRGYGCVDCGVAWWQGPSYAAHIDSGYSAHQACYRPFYVQPTVASEDDFGYYGTISSSFSCSQNDHATTNYWFK